VISVTCVGTILTTNSKCLMEEHHWRKSLAFYEYPFVLVSIGKACC